MPFIALDRFATCFADFCLPRIDSDILRRTSGERGPRVPPDEDTAGFFDWVVFFLLVLTDPVVSKSASSLRKDCFPLLPPSDDVVTATGHNETFLVVVLCESK